MSQEYPNLSWTIFNENSSYIFIGGTAFGIMCNDTILFTDLKSGEQKTYEANGGTSGDGISRLAGNKIYPIFAFAEAKFNPTILVVSYPDYVVLKRLNGDNVGEYIELRFVETEYIVALTGYPDYKMKIWNFRLGLLIAQTDTNLLTRTQKLQCNASPFICAQYAPDLAKINLWEIHVTLDQANIIKRTTNITFLNRFSKIGFIFGLDGNLYLLDSVANLYILQPSIGNTRKLLSWHGEIGSNGPRLENYKGGFLIVGSCGLMKHVKKTGNSWTVQWEYKPDNMIYWIKVLSNNETAYCLSCDSTVSYLEDSSDRKQVIKIGDSENHVNFFKIIRPNNQYIAIITRLNSLRVLDITNKKQISELLITDVEIFESHADLPVICLAIKTGRIYLFSFFKVESPELLTNFQLSDYGILAIRLTQNFIIVQDKNSDFFIISWKMGSQIKIIDFVKCEHSVLEFFGIENNNNLKIFVCFLEKNAQYTEKILILTLTNLLNITKTVLKLPQKYVSISKIDSDTIIASPLMDNKIHYLKWDEEKFTINDKVQTPHQLNYFTVNTHGNLLSTSGLDGLVCIYNAIKKNLQTTLITSNRRNQGDFPKTVDCTAKYVLLLSRNGIFKCFNLKKDQDKTNETDLSHFFEIKINCPIQDPSISWMKFITNEKLRAEKFQFAQNKINILKDLQVLREKLKIEIDENEILSDDDRLSTFSFNLAKEWSDNITEKSRKNRENEDKLLRAYIEDQNRIKQWIIEETWNRMQINSCKIMGIFSKIMCENYTLINQNLKIFDDELEKIIVARKNENDVASYDLWYPWLPYSAMTRFIKEIQMDGSSSSASSISQYVDSEELERKDVRIFALSGTGSHKFIDPNPYRYHQLEVITYNQLFVENFLAQFDVHKLKLYFNKEFEEMVKLKSDQVNYVKQRNARLRVIQFEMNALEKLKNSDKQYNAIIENPSYLPQEKPETIIKVEDWEVSVSPYISPSQQKIIDELAYQAELRRLALLADDFRERALMTMMDGVLEKRWEDEIKKDVPKPDCLIKNKEPGEFTKDDIKALADYEDKVKFIISERERYKVMLDEEEAKIQFIQDDQILKFNRKCGELFRVKLWIDAAIKHEEMKLLRISWFNFERIKIKNMEHTLRTNVLETKIEISELTTLIEEIERRVQEFRGKYDQVQTRDRTLDRQFKLQFAEYAANYVVEQAYKFFKKRPKWIQRAWATGPVLTEMSIRVVQKNSSRTGVPLPEECFEFLTHADNFDSYSLSPNTIDQKLWDILCRMRRLKIESEFKLRSCGVQLAEAESTLNIFTKELINKKAKLAANEKEFQNLSRKYGDLLINRTVQIIMPMALVEVPLTGDIVDFKGCILLSGSDVAEINAIIKKAGTQKLRAMHKVALFRRKVIFKEWEHKVLQMSVQDLKEYLSVIEHSKVTIEMRQWLREKSEGRVVEITNATLARTIEAKIAYMHKDLTEIDEKIGNINKKITEEKTESIKLDKSILNVNIDVTEQNLLRDTLLEEREMRQQKERMQMAVQRGKLIRSIQNDHARILELSTLLELQRLKTFPTLTTFKDPCT